MNRRLLFTAHILGFFLFFPLTAQAEIFRNAYVSFQLPEKWSCNLEGTEWVCTSKLSGKAKEAIIILTAKELGPADTLMAFESYLKAPRTIPGAGGKPGGKSKVIKVERINIKSHQWVDGLHLGSEVNSYYTRYLATTKNRLAILVTFSAHRKFFSKYSGDFLNAINSMKIIASKDLLSNKAKNHIRGAGETLTGPIGGHFEGLDGDIDIPIEPTTSKKGLYSKLLILGLILIAVALFVLRKKK